MREVRLRRIAQAQLRAAPQVQQAINALLRRARRPLTRQHEPIARAQPAQHRYLPLQLIELIARERALDEEPHGLAVNLAEQLRRSGGRRRRIVVRHRRDRAAFGGIHDGDARAFDGRVVRRRRARVSEARERGAAGFGGARERELAKSSRRIEGWCGVGDTQCDDFIFKTHLNILACESRTFESFREDE